MAYTATGSPYVVGGVKPLSPYTQPPPAPSYTPVPFAPTAPAPVASPPLTLGLPSPPPAPAPTAPRTSYAPPPGDLRGTTIGGGGINIPGVTGPALSTLQRTQQLLNQAQQGYRPTADQSWLQGNVMQQLQGLGSAPDRGELAARALALQRQMTDPAWQNDLRLVGQKAAALGRLGSGMTTTELGDVTLQREKALGQYGEDAALQAAQLEMQDRLNRLGATSGYQGQLSQEQLARAGGLGNLAGQQYGVDTTGFNQGMQRSNLQLNSQQAQMQAALQRAQLQMQQQGRQDQLAQLGIDNAARQQMLQEQLLQGAFNRQLTGAQAAGGFGYSGDPYSLMLQAGQYGGQQAAGNQDYLRQLAMQQAFSGAYT